MKTDRILWIIIFVASALYIICSLEDAKKYAETHHVPIEVTTNQDTTIKEDEMFKNAAEQFMFQAAIGY